LVASLDEVDELAAEIDERHFVTVARDVEIEEAAVKGECFVDITHFEGDVIDADGSRLEPAA
jgi:hypothetical protein